MTKTKNTKRALLASVLSMLLCMAMLVGSTFAWFTDSVTSGKNRIVAGNLDVELDYSLDGTTWTEVDENTNMFKENALWEPGYTEVVYLRVRNAGSLALKYRFGINVASTTLGYTADDQPIDLANFIKFGVVDNASTYSADDAGRAAARAAVADSAVLVSAGYASEENHLSKDETSETIALVVYMPEETDNKANHGKDEGDQPSIELGINLVATQYTEESDSFNDQYDKNAVYPDAAYAQLSTQEELNRILNSQDLTDSNGNPTKEVFVELSQGNYTLPAVTDDKKITISSGDDTVIDMTNSGIVGKPDIDTWDTTNQIFDLTMEGAKVNFANEDYKGIKGSKKVTYKDCTITGKQFMYAKEVEFINCKFTQDAVDYNVWTYDAGKVLFKNCEFNCKGKSVLIYNEGHITQQTVEFQNCKFSASAQSEGKAAIEIDSSRASYNVIIDQTTADSVTGFATGSVSKNSLWNVKKNVNPVTVTVAGEAVFNQ